MKVLLVHNDYGKYSGEEAVVDRMASLFTNLGHEVAQLRMSTAGARESLLGQAMGFLNGIYCPSGVRSMREALQREKPDVINVHNLYPFISPAALRECKKAGVPVVMTIHNFRLICPTGLFMRNGGPCEECLERGNEWGCVRHNCEHSALKSLGYAARNFVARVGKHYIDCVDRFACITDFQRKKLIAAGYPAEKIVVIPNAVDAPAERPQASAGDYVAFCGRLSREKGIDLILEAARRHPEVPFCLAGECREPELLANLPGNVQLLGYVKGEELMTFYKKSRFVLMASRCYEGFPMAILEAARYAKPTIGPDHGGFTEIIGRGTDVIGALFTPTDIDSLSTAVADLWHNPAKAQALGQRAFDKLATQYSMDVVAEQWQSLITQLSK